MSEQATRTVFTQITPAGRGAVATLACCGSAALTIVDRCLMTVGKKPLKDRPWSTLTYGHWRMATGAGEDLLVVAHDPENVEIHCHGGTATIDLIAGVLSEQGMQRVDLLGFETSRCGSRWQAEANVCLGQASTPRTAQILLHQQSVLPSWINRLRGLISNGELKQAAREIRKTLDWEDYGRHLLEPRSIVFCGQPNVGKSSLINRVAGFERSIVDDTPGTTRDIVSQLAAVDGWPVVLQDTAGLRVGVSDPIESAGIQNARVLIEDADGVVAVFDASRTWSDADQQLSREPAVDLLVFNKNDVSVESDRPAGLPLSALSGEGVSRFLDTLIDRLIPKHPDPDQPLICLASQSGRLRVCCDALSRSDAQRALDELGG
ncbi:MAG: 50S ribosome-binding GTPase [Mariniblastus sp.]|nr:50S ribosome-binding GTPase [Mariniblastus sp.]